MSLAQFLALFGYEFLLALLLKYDLDVAPIVEAQELRRDPVYGLSQTLEAGSHQQILELLAEIGRTSGDLRNRVEPRYRFDERYSDVRRCLELDGLELGDNGVTQLDPAVEGENAVEDALIEAVRDSGLPDSEAIIESLRLSHVAYREAPPDHNACLTHARIALQTLGCSIAEQIQTRSGGEFNEESWGAVLAYLRASDFLTEREERGLAGVFGFVSPGAHRVVGLTEREIARLGRSLATGMCYFLIRRYVQEP